MSNTSLTGWGRGAWGDAGWGTPLPVEVTTVGAITASVGSVSVVAKADVTPASQNITAAVGTPSILAAAIIQTTGVGSTTALGTPYSNRSCHSYNHRCWSNLQYR